MKNWLAGLFSIGVVTLIFFTTSCKQESNIAQLDTLRIARIYQCDPVLGKEAIIQSILPDTNYGDSIVFTLFTWTNDGLFNISRALLAFDFSAIPPQTIIKKATLSLYWIKYMNLINQTGDNSFSILKITESWDEHTVTWNNQPDTTALFKITVPKSASRNQSYIDIDLTNMVQDMIKNPSQNFGFMLKLEDEFPYKLVVLASSDYPDKSKRPKLVVYF